MFGVIIAWVLVRYEFPGKRILDGCIELPFALPTSVAGITLSKMYSENGILGAPLAKLGIKVSYTHLGLVIALVFVGIPFVIRAVQPVLENSTDSMRKRHLCLSQPVSDLPQSASAGDDATSFNRIWACLCQRDW